MNHTKNINQEIVDKNRLTTTDNDARIIYVLPYVLNISTIDFSLQRKQGC